MSEIVSKSFPKHLLEKAGLQRYTAETGATTITIVYDADREEGWMTAITPDPIPPGTGEKNSRQHHVRATSEYQELKGEKDGNYQT